MCRRPATSLPRRARFVPSPDGSPDRIDRPRAENRLSRSSTRSDRRRRDCPKPAPVGRFVPARVERRLRERTGRCAIGRSARSLRRSTAPVPDTRRDWAIRKVVAPPARGRMSRAGRSREAGFERPARLHRCPKAGFRESAASAWRFPARHAARHEAARAGRQRPCFPGDPAPVRARPDRDRQAGRPAPRRRRLGMACSIREVGCRRER